MAIFNEMAQMRFADISTVEVDLAGLGFPDGHICERAKASGYEVGPNIEVFEQLLTGLADGTDAQVSRVVVRNWL